MPGVRWATGGTKARDELASPERQSIADCFMAQRDRRSICYTMRPAIDIGCDCRDMDEKATTSGV